MLIFDIHLLLSYEFGYAVGWQYGKNREIIDGKKMSFKELSSKLMKIIKGKGAGEITIPESVPLQPYLKTIIFQKNSRFYSPNEKKEIKNIISTKYNNVEYRDFYFYIKKIKSSLELRNKTSSPLELRNKTTKPKQKRCQNGTRRNKKTGECEKKKSMNLI
jgi:hypothetical protein